MTANKKPSDYDACRKSYYLGPVLPGLLQERAQALGCSESKLLRIMLYEKFSLVREMADELKNLQCDES